MKFVDKVSQEELGQDKRGLAAEQN